MQDKAGILLIATGHPYYAHMAVNLAVSIKYHDRDMPISIIQDGQGFTMLEGWKQDLFNVIEAPKEMLNGDPYYLKLNLDKLTPYDKTLFLDVDMVWNNFLKPSELLSYLDGTEFTMVCRNELDPSGELLSRWMDMQAVAAAYKVDKLYDVSSEVMYFEGQPKVFDEARKAYKKPKTTVAKFGDGYPDEAFFIMAMAKLGIAPHEVPFEPTYWEPRYFPKQHSRGHISGFYAMSVGGAYTSSHIKKIYDSLMSHYYNSLGIAATPYQLVPKSRILKERRKI